MIPDVDNPKKVFTGVKFHFNFHLFYFNFFSFKIV